MPPPSSRWAMLEPKAPVRSILATDDRCTAVFHGFGSLHCYDKVERSFSSFLARREKRRGRLVGIVIVRPGQNALAWYFIVRQQSSEVFFLTC